MRNRIRGVAAIGITTAALALSACASSASDAADAPSNDPEVTLTFAHINNEEHTNSRAAQAWMDAVTEATDGSVQFEPFWSGSLCPAAEIAQCVTDGVADIGFTSPAYNPANHPIANISSIGFVTKDLNASNLALNDMYAESDELQAEYDALNQRLLYFEPFVVPGLASTNPDLDEINDLAGQKIRANGSWVGALEYVGAVPLTIDFNEIYESLERGVIDGASVPATAIKDIGIDEVISDFYDLGAYIGVTTTMQTVMNLDAWSELSANQQAAIEAVSAEQTRTKVAEFFEPDTVKACEVLAEAGVDVKPLEPSADTDQWITDVQNSQRDAWAQASGLEDPDAFFEEYESKIEAETSPEYDKGTLAHCE